MTLPSVEVAPSLLHKPSSQVVSNEDKLLIRELTAHVEDEILQSDLRVEVPDHVNHFAEGLYGRELAMPAGFVATGKIHKKSHFLFILKGKALVIDENSGAELMEAPCMFKTKAGTKRAFRILEDSVWVTVHATNETEPDEIEQDLISETHLDALENE
jgi:hypothetical protein